MDYTEYEHRLLNGVLSGSVTAIVEAAYLYFGQPIFLVDSSYKLVEYFPKEAVGDEIFDKIIENKRMPKELIDMIFDSHIYSFAIKQSGAYFLDMPVLSKPRISGAVIYDKHRIGAYGITCEDKPTEQMLQAADRFAAALAVVLDKNSFFTTSGELLENVFMHDLIGGTLKEEGEIIPWGKYCTAITKGGYQMLVGETVQKTSDTELEYLCSRLRAEFTDILPCVENGRLYVLICGVKKVGKAARIADFLHTQTLVCGISRIYHKLQNTTMCCFMAIEALAVGRRQHPARHRFDFETYAINSALDKILSQPYHSVYYHPIFDVLREYDRQNGSELHTSLCEYILAFKDMNAAAKKMNIHRNTLKYRIDRICEIGSIDMEDAHTAMQLFIGSCLAKMENLQ